MIRFLVQFLMVQYYNLFPKYYFSWSTKTDCKSYWVNIENGNWGEVKTKEIIKKKYRWFGAEVKKVVAAYDVNSLLFYAINDKTAKAKAEKKFNEFKQIRNGNNNNR